LKSTETRNASTDLAERQDFSNFGSLKSTETLRSGASAKTGAGKISAISAR